MSNDLRTIRRYMVYGFTRKEAILRATEQREQDIIQIEANAGIIPTFWSKTLKTNVTVPA